jgi:CheY-like chemotaxis protein
LRFVPFSKWSIAVRTDSTTPARSDNLVLVVEDDDSARHALSDMLRLEGFKVESAPNGKEALEFLHSSSPPCAIILDLAMPEMDGWQFRAQQQKEAVLASIPVIVITAFPQAKIDANAILQKPLDLERLIDSVGEYCRDH